MCKVCYNELEIASKFRKMCLQAQEKIAKYRSNLSASETSIDLLKVIQHANDITTNSELVTVKAEFSSEENCVIDNVQTEIDLNER